METLWTRAALAKHLSISLTTLDRLPITITRVGRGIRYAESDVMKWLETKKESRTRLVVPAPKLKLVTHRKRTRESDDEWLKKNLKALREMKP